MSHSNLFKRRTAAPAPSIRESSPKKPQKRQNSARGCRYSLYAKSCICQQELCRPRQSRVSFAPQSSHRSLYLSARARAEPGVIRAPRLAPFAAPLRPRSGRTPGCATPFAAPLPARARAVPGKPLKRQFSIRKTAPTLFPQLAYQVISRHKLLNRAVLLHKVGRTADKPPRLQQRKHP